MMFIAELALVLAFADMKQKPKGVAIALARRTIGGFIAFMFEFVVGN